MKILEHQPMFEMANIVKDITGLPFNIWIDSEGKDRNIGHSSMRIKIRYGGKEISISFYGEPKIESGEQYLSEFGKQKVNEVIKYVKKHIVLFTSHWNHDIDDIRFGFAVNLLRHNLEMSDEEAMKLAKEM